MTTTPTLKPILALSANRSSRQSVIRNQIRRLDQNLVEMDKTRKSLSWWRLLAFSGGVLITYLGYFFGGGWVGTACLAAGIATFAFAVSRYQRLNARIELFQIWRDLRKTQIARMNLDWKLIPAKPAPILEQDSSCASALALDLDLLGDHSLHTLLDRGISDEGTKRLAEWLLASDIDFDTLYQRQRAVAELKHMSRFRDRLYANLKLVSNEPLRGGRMLRWLSVDAPEGRLKNLLILSTIFCTTNICLFVLNITGAVPAVWPVTFLLYLAFYFSTIGSLTPFINAVIELDGELVKFRSLLQFLETFPYQHAPETARLCSIFISGDRSPSRQLRRIRAVTAAAGVRMNPIAALLLNQFTPWDYATAYLANKLRKDARDTIPQWLESWTQLEALCSLADFAYLNPEYTFPSITADCQPVFAAQDLGHPLIPPEVRVCNSFEIGDSGDVILVTGSNMAGKSTFIKTVGINLCLAYAGAPVAASSLRSRFFRLHTCIRISDSDRGWFFLFLRRSALLEAAARFPGNRGPAPIDVHDR